GQHLAIDADTPCGDPGFSFTAGAEAGAGHDLGDALAGLGALVRLGHEARSANMLLGRQASTNAANKRTSAALMWNSGCHCTPTQKRRVGSSMPSTTPSGETASTTAGAGTSFTD